MGVIAGKIPTIDLSEDTKRQVLVDQERNRYLGHVSSTLLPNKSTILAVYVLGHGRGQGIMKKSEDGGVSWSNRLDIPESWSTLLQVPVLFSTMDKTGKQRLLFFTGHYPIRMSVSEDDGDSWSELEPIGDFGGNVAMSDMIQLKNGDYMAFFHDDGRYLGNKRNEIKYQLYKAESSDSTKVELYTSYRIEDNIWSNPVLDERTSVSRDIKWGKSKLIYESYTGKKNENDKSQIYKTVSTDGGLTWGKPTAIVTHNKAFLAEAGVFYSPDKKQLALIMRENTRKYNSFISLSNDEGQSWSNPIQVASELTGDRHNICHAKDGRLVITFRDTAPNSPTYGDWVVWVGTYDDVVNGKNGQYRIRLMKNYYKEDCGYAGLELLEDGSFVAITYGHWEKNREPYIVSVTFELKDLEQEYLSNQEVERIHIT